MKYNSTSVAKLVILCSLAIATTSAYYGKTFSEKAQGTKSELTKLEKDLQKARASSNDLSTSLAPENAEYPMERTFSDNLLFLMKGQLAYGVSLSSVVANKQTGQANVTDAAALAEPVPNTPLRSIRLNVRGTYESYSGLLNYLAALRQRPVAIVHLKVEDKNFEMGVRIYGT